MTAFSVKLKKLIESVPGIDLATALNLPQPVIEEYLAGTLAPTLQVVYDIADVFHLEGTARLTFYEISALSYFTTTTPPPPINNPDRLTVAYIKTLAAEGTAWTNVFQAAQNNTDSPKLSDQNDKTDTDVLAKAFVWANTGEAKYRDEVMVAIENVMGTEVGAGILAIVRNITGYVIAAKLVDLEPTLAQTFKDWLVALRQKVFIGAGPSLSIISCNETRPNNFGTHAGAARIAIAAYLEDTTDLNRAITVFKGWLGDRSAYAGFTYGDLSWQCDPAAPVGINPAGCTKAGENIDGVLPDDQRRGGSFTWPPPKENYVYEALQGAVLQAELLAGMGYAAWDWSDKAILRAFKWLYNVANFPAESDDDWLPHIINSVYGTTFLATSPTSPGKAFGWADWLYG